MIHDEQGFFNVWFMNIVCFFPCFFTLADEIYYNSSAKMFFADEKSLNSSAKMFFADEKSLNSSAIDVFYLFLLHTLADEINCDSSAKLP